jgi:Cu/Ag efflux protein CusF
LAFSLLEHEVMNSLNAILVSTALAAMPVAASSELPHSDSQPILVASAHEAMTEGEVRKVDLATRKITIKHGELRNLDMPAMTMVFQVKDTNMLDKVKAGDKVKFRAEKINGVFTVLEMETVK